MEKLTDVKLELTLSKKFKLDFRYLMSKVAEVEWGGLVVYDIKNSYLDETIEIELIDFVLMDIGSISETNNNYEDNPFFVKMLMKYPNTNYGLIHSHNTGKVYYSSTDIIELEKNTKFYPKGYLSVVTNTRGDILARLSNEFNSTMITTIDDDTHERDIKYTFKSIHYIETKININEESKEIATKIKEIKKINKKINDKEKLTGEHHNSINNNNWKELYEEMEENIMTDHFHESTTNKVLTKLIDY